MKQITADESKIAYCGLYCGSCGSYLKGKCPGCHENTKATWCGIRTCCIENKYKSCADCKTHSDPKSCGKFHNFISKVIGFILRSDRSKCIAMIKEKGYEDYAKFMTETKQQSLKK